MITQKRKVTRRRLVKHATCLLKDLTNRAVKQTAVELEKAEQQIWPKGGTDFGTTLTRPGGGINFGGV